ncbi:hypothetical protein FGO68_gene14510 [Halteria grandinella]|uniref:Uncharacterized protein n=1 Tax=Halteria grandinella TaxID=5974 RepID=A0A8J8NQN5_HALGN|nr:hypothetical protein FGO68_gene14510 [Halteria grandinella]
MMTAKRRPQEKASRFCCNSISAADCLRWQTAAEWRESACANPPSLSLSVVCVITTLRLLRQLDEITRTQAFFCYQTFFYQLESSCLIIQKLCAIGFSAVACSQIIEHSSSQYKSWLFLIIVCLQSALSLLNIIICSGRHPRLIAERSICLGTAVCTISLRILLISTTLLAIRYIQQILISTYL